jgi:hypothetical protein
MTATDAMLFQQTHLMSSANSSKRRCASHNATADDHDVQRHYQSL